MKASKFFFFMLVAVSLSFSISCNKDDDNGGDGNQDIIGTPVTITGVVNSETTQAKKIVAISSTDRYKISDIVNNQFSIELDNGKPWGIIFLNEMELPLGFLSLDNGIESLPLNGITPGTDSINLKTVISDGNIFIPEHNPIGAEIILTDEQKESIATMDDYLAALLKNPDVNNNGKIDLLEGKLFKLEVIYFIKPGNFIGGDLIPTYNSYKLIEGYKLFLTVKDENMPNTLYFTGPAGSPLNNSQAEGFMDFGSHRMYSTTYIYDLLDTVSCIPVSGQYKIQYKGTDLIFNLPNQDYVKSNIVYPWPTIVLNSGGTMNKIDWVYRAPAGIINFNLSVLIRSMQIQIEGEGNKCESSNSLGSRLYDSPWLPVSTTSHALSCQNIDWGSVSPSPGWKHVDRVMMTYEDHYETSYVVMYERRWN